MHKILSLARVGWTSAASYRLNLILSIVGMLVSVIPLYFVAGALQPVVADAIRSEGGEYFGFLIVGMVAFALLRTSVNSLTGALGRGITTGTFEGLLSTPTRIPTLLAVMVTFPFIWAVARALLFLAAGWLFGAAIAWDRIVPAAVLLALIVAAHIPFGLLACSSVLAFRTAGPIPQGVNYVSMLLGGVYYPTHVIPDWIQDVSAWIPLTYGLRALRRVLLGGEAMRSVLPDLLILLAFTLGLFVVGGLVFGLALRYARRAGTLTQY